MVHKCIFYKIIVVNDSLAPGTLHSLKEDYLYILFVLLGIVMIVRDIQDQKIFIVRCVTLVHLKMEELIDTVLNVIDV